MAVTIYSQGRHLEKKAADNALSFEQQFGTLAYHTILQKLPILQPYVVGFELLDSNQDGTEGVGTMIFLVGTQVIYIPAFFRNNKLVAGDFMILAGSNQFMTASEALISELRGNHNDGPAKPIKDEDLGFIRKGTPGSARTTDRINPLTKAAAVAPDKNNLRNSINELLDEASSIKTPSIFDIAVGLGKQASEVLLDKLTSDRQFLQDTLGYYTAQDLLEFTKEASAAWDYEERIEKKASALDPFEVNMDTLSAAERNMVLKYGFLIKSAAEGTAKAVMTPREICDREITTVNRPGVYMFMTPSGDFVRAVVLSLNTPRMDNDYCDSAYLSSYQGDERIRVSGPLNNDASNAIKNRSYGELVYVTEDMDASLYAKLPKNLAGVRLDTSRDQWVGLISSMGDALEEMSILPERSLLVFPDGTSEGLGCSSFYPLGGKDYKSWTTGDMGGLNIVVSPEYKTPHRTKNVLTVPEGTRVLVSLTTHCLEKHQDKNGKPDWKKAVAEESSMTEQFVTVNEALRQTGKLLGRDDFLVRIKNTDGRFSVSPFGEVTVTNVHSDSEPMGIKEAALKLTDMGVDPTEALAALEAVQPKPGFSAATRDFFIIKKASVVPGWEQNQGYSHGSSPYDIPKNMSYENFVEQPPEVQTLGAQALGVVGESNEQLLNAVHRAAEKGVKEVFDVSVLKMMLKSSNPTNLVGDYLSDLSRTMDKLGRMLMLIYSHMDVFEKQYGDTKLPELIETIKSTMDNIGEIMVYLKNRNILQISLRDGVVDGLESGTIR